MPAFLHAVSVFAALLPRLSLGKPSFFEDNSVDLDSKEVRHFRDFQQTFFLSECCSHSADDANLKAVLMRAGSK